jgi:hypothetical protein
MYLPSWLRKKIRSAAGSGNEEPRSARTARQDSIVQ